MFGDENRERMYMQYRNDVETHVIKKFIISLFP